VWASLSKIRLRDFRDEPRLTVLGDGQTIADRVEYPGTILVRQDGHPETIRLIGVDTPETKDPRKPVVYEDACPHHKSL